MNFLNVGPWELTVIVIIAILLVGPQRMVEVARAIGQATRQMRSLSGEFLGAIREEVDSTGEEARRALEDVVEEGEGSLAELQAAGDETRQALGQPGDDKRPAPPGIVAELEAVEQEARHAMQDIVESVGSIVRGEEEVKEEGEDEKANA